MGLRFRKSINIGGARVNISKKGIGGSIGVKGARLTKTADGKTRKTVGIAGTGISYTTQTSKKQTVSNSVSSVSSAPITNYKAISALLKVLGIILIILSAVLWLVLLPVGMAFTAFGVLILLMAKSYKKKAIAEDKEAELTNESNNN